MEKLKIVLKYVFFAIIAVGLLVSFTSRCGYGTDDIDEARKEAYEEGYEAGQEDILDDPGAYELTSYDDTDDYRAYVDDAYNEGYSEGYEDGSKDGYLACLENCGITEEGW